MDMILRNAILGGQATPVDSGFQGGKIAAIASRLAVSGSELDLGGRMSFTRKAVELHAP